MFLHNKHLKILTFLNTIIKTKKFFKEESSKITVSFILVRSKILFLM